MSPRAVLTAAALLLSCSAFAAETGYPLITFFRQEQHKGGAQTFDADRDAHGRMYFANGEGVLIHDGAWWSRVRTPATAFEVRAHPNLGVGVSVTDDIGIIAGDTYQSLAPKLPAELRANIGQAGVCSTAEGLLFATERFTAVWNGSALRILERNAPGGRGQRCSETGGRVYLTGFGGMHEAGGPQRFAGRRVDAVIRPYAIVRNEGLFLFDGTAVDNEASRWLRNKGVMQAIELRDGRIAIATLRFGLLIMTRDGRIEQIIDAAAGLPNVFLYAVEEDAEGSLWLAMDTVIARIDAGTPVSMFDRRVGLDGTIVAMARHDGTLHIASQQGVFVLDADKVPARARRLPGLENNNPWALLSAHGDLLAGTYGGVFVMRNGGAERIPGTEDETVFAMVHSRRDPSLVWLAMESGLAKLRRVANGWLYEGRVANSPPHAYSLVESGDGMVWYGTSTEGVIRVDPSGAIARFGSGDAYVIVVAKRMVIVTREGFFQPGPRNAFVRDPLLGHLRGSDTTLIAHADVEGNVWMSTRPPTAVRRKRDGSYETEGHVVAAMSGDGTSFFADADGAMWIGSDRGLYRIAARSLAGPAMQPAPMIRRVTDVKNRALAAGAELPHNFGRVRIEVAPLSYRAATQYQYRLDPIDTEWSPWTEQAFLDYTHLGANDYTFRVRTRGAAGVVSAEARWPFTVKAPWYATRWAAALWIALAALLLAAIVWLRTRTLRKRARVLQELVDEQTQLLLDANERLEQLSLVDPLTGLANRRAFDRAVTEAWKRSVRHALPLSVVMMDIDHFKELNDSRGHAAGDDCLRQVADFLDNAIRGNGDDMVARWGGEEFAILLSSADEAAAVTIAERLRTGIAAYGITASFGVAARMHESDPAQLLRGADNALYKAKRSGRNCVRIATRSSRVVA
jgi:diguanylate cyclase (GGDEF)-like protein